VRHFAQQGRQDACAPRVHQSRSFVPIDPIIAIGGLLCIQIFLLE